MPWGIISLTSDEPEGTSVTVKVRSSNDGDFMIQFCYTIFHTQINAKLFTRLHG